MGLSKGKKYRFLGWSAAVAVLTIIAIEVFFWIFLQFPSWNNLFGAPKATSIRVYYNHLRNIIQFQPDCAQYDDELTYLLKPGECEFSNLEFSTHFSVNEAGLRDDAKSLIAPEVIMIGDSYTLGWGVEQQETFTQQIEQLTGKKTLNAGMSSFGTARETALLKRLDTSDLRWLIVQYCNNDFEENRAFVENDFQLKPTSKEDYEGLCAAHVSRKKYSPLLYLRTFLEVQIKERFWKSRYHSDGNQVSGASARLGGNFVSKMERPMTAPPPPTLSCRAQTCFGKASICGNKMPPQSPNDSFNRLCHSERSRGIFLCGKWRFLDFARNDTMGMGKSVRHTPFANNPPSKPKTEAQHFLAILSQAQIPAQTRVIILVLSPFRFDTNMFLSEVKEEIARVSYPAFTENAILLDTESLLNKEDHFVLDEHLRASGHRKIAESISEIIKSPDL